MIDDLVAILLVQFTGPTGQRIDVNPAEVTSIREPQPANRTYLAKGINCLIGMSNGKFIAVRDGCSEVRQALRGGESPCVLVCGEAPGRMK